MTNSGETISQLTPAASLIVIRETAADVEILMLRRSSSMIFAPNAWVFPGGRVDAADMDLAAELSSTLPLTDAAGRIAAIRETLEECGLAIGLLPVPDAQVAWSMRMELSQGTTLAELLVSRGLTIDFSIISPYARWCPGEDERVLISRQFDAHIYVTRAVRAAGEVEVDCSEISEFDWVTASSMLQSCEDGTALALFPTRRILERLATARRFEDVTASMHADPFQPIIPWTETRAGIKYLCIPAGRGYPVTDEPLSRVQRELVKGL